MITRVLVALDGSSRAPAVFDAAAEMAARFHAQLFALTVIMVPPEFPAAAAGSGPDPLPAHLSNNAVASLERLTTRAPHVRVHAPILRIGEPWRMILAVSEELDVDLIVLGSHGYSGIDRLLGTTAAHVANRARRSVLVVHERVGHSPVNGPNGLPGEGA